MKNARSLGQRRIEKLSIATARIRASVLLVGAMALQGLSCSSASSSSLPPDIVLTGVGGSGPNDVWITSETSSTWHWNGTVWTQSTIANANDGTHRVWSSGPTDAWAVGHDGAFHWDGSSWSASNAATTELFDVWGSATNDVWTVGAMGTIVHWDGAAWSPFPTGAQPLDDLFTVWGIAANDVWALGISAPFGVMHWDGQTWSSVTFPPQPPGVSEFSGWYLRGVWGGSSNDVWVVGGGTTDPHFGDTGTLAHWDGTTWTRVDRGDALAAIWGTSHADIWAVGDHGAIHHFDGTNWEGQDSGVSITLTGVWGSGPRDVWAVGYQGTIVHYDGDKWSVTHQAAP